VDDAGKEAQCTPGSLAEELVGKGFVVMVPDLPGYGELAAPPDFGHLVVDGLNYSLFFGAQMIGRSLTGIQASILERSLNYLLRMDCVDTENISAVAKGVAGPALLHTASSTPVLKNLALMETPVSWRSVLEYDIYDKKVGLTLVPSALNYYDLPDLLALIAPARTAYIDPVDGDGEPASASTLNDLTEQAGKYYEVGDSGFAVLESNGEANRIQLVMQWLTKR
jgi:hypothetical protein